MKINSHIEIQQSEKKTCTNKFKLYDQSHPSSRRRSPSMAEESQQPRKTHHLIRYPVLYSNSCLISQKSSPKALIEWKHSRTLNAQS